MKILEYNKEEQIFAGKSLIAINKLLNELDKQIPWYKRWKKKIMYLIYYRWKAKKIAKLIFKLNNESNNKKLGELAEEYCSSVYME